MALSASSGLPACAAARSFSSMSVILVMAECTTSTRWPECRRRWTTKAMLRQLASVETLVPPNLTTTQRDAERADMGTTPSPSPATTHCDGKRAFDLRSVLVVFEGIFEIFFEPAIREHFF